jgi:nicotinamidase-related amidase
MKPTRVFLYLILIAFIVGVACVMTAMGAINRPTKGRKIAAYPAPHRALLVIDLQDDFLDPTKYPMSDSVFRSVNILQNLARQDSIPVIHIRQEFSGIAGKIVSRCFMQGKGVAGSPGAAMTAAIEPLADADFVKHRGDAFSNPKLDEYLAAHQIDELYLTGIDGEFCVRNTAYGALNRGYKVNLVQDAVMAGNWKKWDALRTEYTARGVRLIDMNNFRDGIFDSVTH